MAQELIHIGGRSSKLAVIQSETVKQLIESAFPGKYNCVITKRTTLGDQVQTQPLYSFGGKSLWVTELEDLLLGEPGSDSATGSRLDLIVHSLKDMPTTLPESFELGGITKRVDPSDCVVMARDSPFKSLSELPDGSVVGTSSVRRTSQLRRLYPKLIFKSVRGNIQTRLSKLDDPESEYKCIVLATAGLVRLQLEHRITQTLSGSEGIYHAVGQGALGIEIRKGDHRIQQILDKICDYESTVCCLAERALLRFLEGGCSVPIGVTSEFDNQSKTLRLRAIVIDTEGVESVEESQDMVIRDNSYREDSEKCGVALAEKMIANGAKKILDEINLTKLK